jgi:hypothetical protein
LRFGLLGEADGEKLLPEAAEEAEKKWPLTCRFARNGPGRPGPISCVIDLHCPTRQIYPMVFPPVIGRM